MGAVNQLIENTLLALKDRGWSRADLVRAAHPHISKAYVYLMLDDAYDSSVKKWEQLAEAMGFTLDELLVYHKGSHHPGSEELQDYYDAASDNARKMILASAKALSDIR